LEGSLVRLRPMSTEGDVEEWFGISHDKKMHLWTGNEVPSSIQEVEKLLLEVYPEYFMIWMIEEKRTGNVIGMMRISYPTMNEGQKVAGDSQRLHSDYWRKGYMKESRKLIYDYVFRDLQVEALYADVWKGNTNSEKSLESVGYEFLFEKEEYFEKYDRLQMKRYYQLTRESWMKK